MDEQLRINKYLSSIGYCSRREADRLLEQGKIQVDGHTAFVGERITKEQYITVNGIPVGEKPREIVIAFNKPKGIVCTSSVKEKNNIVDYLHFPTRIYPVGRLDKDTEGLLLITDDGMLAHELLAPGKHVDKTYFVRVEGKLTVENIEKLENGVDIGEEKLTMPARAEIVGGSWEGAGDSQPGRVRIENLPEVYTELHLTIHEGKFHQVKRMMAAVGKPVIYLKRISMGPLTLPDNLKKGECRPLTEEELLWLKG